MDELMKLSSILDNSNDVPSGASFPIEGEGTKVLALLNGSWIVLEVGCESPSYEETFSPFLYWFEPYNNMHSIEYYDVSEWNYLPEQSGADS